MKQSIFNFPRLSLNSACCPGRHLSHDLPSSVSQAARITGLYHQACLFKDASCSILSSFPFDFVMHRALFSPASFRMCVFYTHCRFYVDIVLLVCICTCVYAHVEVRGQLVSLSILFLCFEKECFTGLVLHQVGKANKPMSSRPVPVFLCATCGLTTAHQNPGLLT